MVLGSGDSSHDGVMPDAIFEDPRLVRVYDPLDPDRSDLDAYVAFIHEAGATSVLDVGCGTGTLALEAHAPSGCSGSTAMPRRCRRCRSMSP
jgi:SAM-dependent methyltransferase